MIIGEPLSRLQDIIPERLQPAYRELLEKCDKIVQGPNRGDTQLRALRKSVMELRREKATWLTTAPLWHVVDQLLARDIERDYILEVLKLIQNHEVDPFFEDVIKSLEGDEDLEAVIVDADCLLAQGDMLHQIEDLPIQKTEVKLPLTDEDKLDLEYLEAELRAALGEEEEVEIEARVFDKHSG